MNREEARAFHKRSMRRVATTPPPANQKYPPGTRVWIKTDLGPYMQHFQGGCWATVEFTDAHAYGGKDVDSYSLMVDGVGSVAWYYESQLSLTEETDEEKKLGVEKIKQY